MTTIGIIFWIIAASIGGVAAYPLNMPRFSAVMIALLIARTSGAL